MLGELGVELPGALDLGLPILEVRLACEGLVEL